MIIRFIILEIYLIIDNTLIFTVFASDGVFKWFTNLISINFKWGNKLYNTNRIIKKLVNKICNIMNN